MVDKKTDENEERVHLEDISGKPSFYRLMAFVDEHLRHAIENHPEELVIKTMGGPLPSLEETRSTVQVARAGDWQDDPILGKTPSATVANLLSELLEYARAARDIPDAIQKVRPLDPSVFERAWVNELFGILDGVTWMFEIVHLVGEREAQASGTQLGPLPQSFKEKQIEEAEAELRPARDKLVAHYFGNLRGQLTIREYFNIRVGQHSLKHAHEVIDRSIEALWEWYERNGVLVEKHLNQVDLKRMRKRKTKGKRKPKPTG